MISPSISFPKAILTLAGLLFGFLLHAQQDAAASFEGTVVYNIRVSGKQAQAYMVNEPPKQMTMHVKENNFIVKLSGGRIPRTFLFIADSNHTYIVDFANSRYFQRTYYNDTSNVKPVAVPTGETKKIKGRDCMEYVSKRTDRKENTYYYVHDDFRVDTTLFDTLDGAKADFLIQGLAGRIPLMKVIKTPGLETSVELAVIKHEKFPIEAFAIPEGFSGKKKRDPRK